MKSILLVLALAVASPVRAQRADQLPRTNSLAPGDLLTVTTSPDSTNRSSRGVPVSGLADSLSKIPSTNAVMVSPQLRGHLTRFVFAGDSQSTDSSSYSGAGMSFPEYLMVQPAWSGGLYYNRASNGMTLALLRTNFATQIAPLLTGPGPSYLMLDGAYNDLGNGVGHASLTNRACELIAMARTNNPATVIGLIIPPHGTNWDSGKLAEWTNYTAWASAAVSGDVVDWGFDRGAFLTNRSVQTVDGIHQTPAANAAMAAQIASSIQPQNNYAGFPVRVPAAPMVMSSWSMPRIAANTPAPNTRGLNLESNYEQSQGFTTRAWNYDSSQPAEWRLEANPLQINAGGGLTDFRASVRVRGTLIATNEVQAGVGSTLRLLSSGQIRFADATLLWMTNGALALLGTNTSPGSPSSVAAWKLIYIDGVAYRLPLYQ